MDLTPDIKKRGRQKKYLTEDDLARLERMAGLGCSEEEYAAACDMSINTFLRIKAENPGVQQIIAKAATVKKVKIAQHVFNRATESDKVAMFYMTSQGGWNPKSGEQTNVTINQNTQINNTENNAIIPGHLDHISQQELEHYRNLSEEDLYTLIRLENPSTEPGVIHHEPVETIETTTDDVEPQKQRAMPAVVESGSKEEKRAVKDELYESIIVKHLVITGVDQSIKPSQQKYKVSADEMDSLFKQYGINGVKNKGAFFKLLLAKGVDKKRIVDSKTGIKNFYYLGCYLK